MPKFKLSNREIAALLDIDTPQFPKYVTQIINLANQNAQGTRPKVVGKMSELVAISGSRSPKEWEEWYVSGHPDALNEASKKIWTMISRLKDAIADIDEAMVKRWVKDLVIAKTYIGLRFHEAILKRVAAYFGRTFRLSTPEEESAGIDGWIGDKAVSIKPATYKTKASLPENIEVFMIYYSKKKDGITVEFDENLE